MSGSSSFEVVVLGAGLSGLACAKRLRDCGVDPLLIEASDAVGGRVRTDVTSDGFRLDRGFQLYLTAYPEGRRVLDYEALQLREFVSGAKIWHQGRFHRVADPRTEPLTGLRSLLGPIGTMRDKLRLIRMKMDADRTNEETVGLTPDQTTLDYFQQTLQVSPALLERFLRPFFGGVFLERNLDTSARFFRFVYRMFTRGPGAVPAKGMQQIPLQLAENLPSHRLWLRAPALRVEPGRVTLVTGEVIHAKQIVVATNATTAARLLPGVIEAPRWNGNTTIYYAAAQSPHQEGILALNGDGTGLVNSVAVLSDVSPEYAPAGASLISCAIIGVPDLDDQALDQAARQQLLTWYGDAVKRWWRLRVDRIPEALPSQPVGRLEPWRRRQQMLPGIVACGDYLDQASIDGALSSGYRAAQTALQALRTVPQSAAFLASGPGLDR